MDVTELCTPLEVSKYRSLIGSANWIIALEKYDIGYVTSTLAKYSTLPRKGYYKAAQRIFGYLGNFPHCKIFLDVIHSLVKDMVKIDINKIWTDVYPDAEESLASDLLEPLIKECTLLVM